MIIDMVLVHIMQPAIMNIINMITMWYHQVTVIRAMHVIGM